MKILYLHYSEVVILGTESAEDPFKRFQLDPRHAFAKATADKDDVATYNL